jgi:hypothetical protein
MQVQSLRDRRVDQLEEPQELLAAVAPVVLGDHRAAADVEGGEQVRGAVPDVVMRHSHRGGGRDRQDRRGPVDRLHLDFSSTASTRAFSGGAR